MKIMLAGCGALGSRVAKEMLYLFGPEDTLLLVDDDWVEAGNVSTTLFKTYDVGKSKVAALAGALLYHTESPPEIQEYKCMVQDVSVTPDTLVIDCLDNFEGRSWLHYGFANVLHAGVSAQGTGLVAWGYDFPIPDDWTPRGENPVCTRNLGNRILRLTAAATVSALEDFIQRNAHSNFLITNTSRIETV